MNDSHSNLVNRVFYGSNGTIWHMKISVFLQFKTKPLSKDTKEEKRKIVLHSTFNVVDPGDFDKKNKKKKRNSIKNIFIHSGAAFIDVYGPMKFICIRLKRETNHQTTSKTNFRLHLPMYHMLNFRNYILHPSVFRSSNHITITCLYFLAAIPKP